DDRNAPERCAGRDADPDLDGCADAEVGRTKLRPDAEQEDETERQREILRGGEDRDLLGGELVEASDRDREDATREQHGDVGKKEREHGAQQDRPEAPARKGGCGRRDLYRSPVRRARSAASSTTSLHSEASGRGVRVKTPISATSSGISAVQGTG